MKKFILLLFSFCSVILFSQQKTEKNKKSKDSLNKKLWEQEYLRSKKQEIVAENHFYKNIDSTKASKYRILTKKPTDQYYRLNQSQHPSQLYKIEKPLNKLGKPNLHKKDSITINK